MASTTKKMTKARRYLPAGFEPHMNDVLIGRGRMVETHNKNFRAMINAHLAAYNFAQTKATKSTIILRIFQTVKRGGGTGFVKREATTKRWYVIEDASARISIAQAFRDALSSEYKSSKQYKQQKRKEERGEDTCLMGLLSTEALPSVIPSPPSLVPVVSAESVSSSSSSASRSCSLQAILEQASNVVASVDAESKLRNAPEEAPLSQCNRIIRETQDLLAGLEQAIGAEVDLTSNPFEPTPLMDVLPAHPNSSASSMLATSDLLLGDGDADLMDSINFTLQQPQQPQPDDFMLFDALPTTVTTVPWGI